MQSEKRLYLIRALLRERREDLSVPPEEQAQKRLLRALFQALFKGLLFYYRGTKKCVLYKPGKMLYTVLASRGTDPPRSKNPNYKGISNEHFQKTVLQPQK